MNEQKIIHHLLGIGDDVTPQRILAVASCEISDDEIARAIESRASRIMQSLPGPQFVPLMLPVRHVLEQAGRELRQERDEKQKAAREQSPPDKTPQSAPEQSPPKPRPVAPHVPVQKAQKENKPLLAAGAEASAAQLLFRYDEDFVNFLTEDEKLRVLQIRHPAFGQTKTAATEALAAFWQERSAAGRRGWTPRPAPSAPESPAKAPVQKTPIPTNAEQIVALAQRLGCSPEALTAQCASWNKQVAETQSPSPGPVPPSSPPAGSTAAVYVSAPRERNLLWRAVGIVIFLAAVLAVASMWMNRNEIFSKLHRMIESHKAWIKTLPAPTKTP